MSDETTETIEAPDAQIIPFKKPEPRDPDSVLGDGPDEVRVDPDVPDFHPILEVWREVLKPARVEATKPVTPQWANKMISTHAHLHFNDMEDLRDSYFGRIEELYQILLDEISVDDECLNVTTPEEDREHNSQHYSSLLVEWQKTFLRWELDWHTMSPTAAVDIAAISEIHKLFFGQTGVTQFLDNIKFDFTEDDQAFLAGELERMKEER